MLIDVLAYRDWACNLTQRLMNFCYENGYDIHLHRYYEKHCPKADLTFLIGWSAIVPEDFYRDRMVLVLHPSPLPKYRGGSPIQHQIIAGEKQSSVSLFKLDKDYPLVDSGPLCFQASYSLEGNLSDVLARITEQGQKIVRMAIEGFVSGELSFWCQNERYATTFKRRYPAQSEITQEELQKLTAEQLYNKIRALQDPYPNAFIQMPNGEKLYLTGAHL